MTAKKEPKQYEVQDWAVAALIYGPFLFVIVGQWFQFTPPLTLKIAIHYSIYLSGLALAIGYFVLAGLKRSIEWIERQLPIVIAFTFIWDIITPLTGIASFSLLKALFYLLVFVHFSHLVFGRGRLLRSSSPYPLALLLMFATVLYFNQGLSSVIELSTLETQPFFQTVFTTRFIGFVAFLAMLALPISLLFRPNWLSQVRVPTIILASALAIVLAGNAFLQSIDYFASNVGKSATTTLAPLSTGDTWYFAVELPCLYLFLVVLALYNDEPTPILGVSIKLANLLGFIFSATFLLLYIEANKSDIVKAITEVLKYWRSFDPWFQVVISILALVANIAAVVQFNREKPRSQPILK